MRRMHDGTVRRLSHLHRLLFLASKGKVGGRLVRNDMLLLTTVGRATGHPHTVPLLYLRDGADVVVIASYGGRDYAPDWFLNLQSDPAVSVHIGGDHVAGVATVMNDAERAEWWEQFVAAYDGYVAYQDRTERIIPIVRIGIDGGTWTASPADGARGSA